MTSSLAQSLAGTSPVAWAIDFLQRAQLPETPANMQVVYSWEYAESGAGGGMWNPLNTTQGGYAGETNANAVGVKNYVTRDDGLNANAKVIHNGFYPNVVAAFEHGNDALAVVNAIVVSPWGTRHIALRDVPGTPLPPPPAPHPKPQEDDMPTVIPIKAKAKNGRLPFLTLHSDTGEVWGYNGVRLKWRMAAPTTVKTGVGINFYKVPIRAPFVGMEEVPGHPGILCVVAGDGGCAFADLILP